MKDYLHSNVSMPRIFHTFVPKNKVFNRVCNHPQEYLTILFSMFAIMRKADGYDIINERLLRDFQSLCRA